MSEKQILIIDDDKDLLDSISFVLKNNGFSVLEAQNGEQGIKLAQENNPDFILCDMMMESIDSGATVAEKIRQSNKNVPIYLSSSISDTTAENYDTNKLGFSGVMQKPLDPSKLIEQIKKVLAM